MNDTDRKKENVSPVGRSIKKLGDIYVESKPFSYTVNPFKMQSDETQC